MILFTIGSDRNLFKKNSDIWKRYLDYGKLFEEIHEIVFSHKNLSNQKAQIGDNIFIYPTSHVCKLFYLWNIYKIVRKIIPSVVNRESWVISVQDPFEAGLAGWMIKKIFNLPLQIQVHTDFLSPYFSKESLLNKIRVSLAKFLISRADGIRVVSERIRKSLVVSCKSLVVSRIVVLPIFVDVESIKNTPVKVDLHKKYPQFEWVVLMASRLSKEKNIGLALEAFKDLIKKYPKLGLIICGGGPEFNKLKVECKNLGIDKNVAFEGWAGDLISYYKTADLFLLTSNYEGYGRSVVEAMAADLPVIMSDVGLAGEVLKNGENGLIFPVGAKEAMIEDIEGLLNDKKRALFFGIAAGETAQSLMTQERYLRLYKEIIESIRL
jgi:glycosyltransferase involved in cell wall biosynthesis